MTFELFLTRSERELRAWLAWTKIRAEDLVDQFTHQIMSISEALLAQKTLYEGDILRLLTQPSEE